MAKTTFVSRYEYKKLLHPGTASKVWYAEDVKNNIPVAIKELIIVEDSTSGLETGVHELFKRECDSLERLKHENIITYIDSGFDRKKMYIVTEWFESVSLERFIQENTTSYLDVLEISISILKGLAEAHRKNVIHRDIKPSNILINDAKEIKIIDFGISKILDITYNPVKTLRDYMTPAYAAPEQLLRNPARPQSDLYSIGAIMAFMFTKKNPPEDKTQIGMYLNEIQCPEEIMSLIFSLMNDKLDKRPHTADEVLRIITQEYYKRRTDSNIYSLSVKPGIARKLYEFGLINYSSSEYVIAFIENDLKECNIYKNKDTFYLIGKTGKYHLKLQENNLIVFNVSILDNYIDLENEKHKGLQVDGHFIVNIVKSRFDYPTSNNEALLEFLQTLIDYEARRKVKQEREKEENKLINRWEQYLKEEIQINQQKKRVCQYTRFEENEDGTIIEVTTDSFDLYNLNTGDPIQLTSTKNKQFTIGKIEGIKGNLVSISLEPDVNTIDIAPRGSLGVDVIQTEASIKRLSYAIKDVKMRNAQIPNLIDLLRDPQLISSPIESGESIDFIQPKLDIDNKIIVEKSLRTKNMFLIQGPPGTGKTTVITEIVCQILNKNPEARILLSSQSHVAVDQALNRIVEIIPEFLTIRIGHSDRISADSEHLKMANQLRNWVLEVKQRSYTGLVKYLTNHYDISDKGLEQINEHINNKSPAVSWMDIELDKQFNEQKQIAQLAQTTKEWYQRLGKVMEFDEIFAQRASIVAATCVGIASRHVVRKMTFDWVIIDEAARATAPELLVPMIRGKKIILVGDHRQLPPVVKNINKLRLSEKYIRTADLEQSLFEQLIENAPVDSKSVLTSQFRMHPVIAKLINKVFYPTDKIITKTTVEERKHYTKWQPQSIIWVSTQNIHNHEEDERLKSKRNRAEAEVILSILEEIEIAYQDSEQEASIAIISGYNAQKTLLTSLIRPNKDNKWKKLKITIDNVDAFQGSQADIVIYSIVRCNKDKEIGFLYDERRLNVALSRGKSCLIIVGDPVFIKTAYTVGPNPFIDIIRFIKDNPDDCIMEVLQ